mmetsp:Transcript_13103/g.35290  ORF Transcript_13103/g.35290 Transcript_13103/m.35290 type:complete len:90 (-) Transcript_13103:1350-1619(-)
MSASRVAKPSADQAERDTLATHKQYLGATELELERPQSSQTSLSPQPALQPDPDIQTVRLFRNVDVSDISREADTLAEDAQDDCEYSTR